MPFGAYKGRTGGQDSSALTAAWEDGGERMRMAWEGGTRPKGRKKRGLEEKGVRSRRKVVLPGKERKEVGDESWTGGKSKRP